MKFPTFSSVVSTVALGASLNACSMIPLNPDAGSDAQQDSTDVGLTDGGVPVIENQINAVVAAAKQVVEVAQVADGGVTEENYARYVLENPPVGDFARPGYFEYNSFAEFTGFGDLGDPEAKISVRTYNQATNETPPTMEFAEMYARFDLPPREYTMDPDLAAQQAVTRLNNAANAPTTELDISIYTDTCEIPPPSDKLTLSFDFNRAKCDSEHYTITTIQLSVSHVDPNAPDAGVPDMNLGERPAIIESCRYSYGAGRQADTYGNLMNIPLTKIDLPPNDPYCETAARAIIESLNTELPKYSVCSPILPNLGMRIVGEDTCL